MYICNKKNSQIKSKVLKKLKKVEKLNNMNVPLKLNKDINIEI